MKAEIPEKYQIALDKFIDKYKKNKDVIGILLTGSFIHSKPDKNSDLDIHIITKKSKVRERGNTWINGVEIEYFMNPVKQILNYFEEENKKSRPCTAHMFVNSRVLFKKGKETENLIRKARKYLEIKPKKISFDEKELLIYFMDDLEKDLEDVYLRKDFFAFYKISEDILKKSLEAFYKINRVYDEKTKRLFNYLNLKDKEFAKVYGDALIEQDIEKKYKKLIELIRHVEKTLGGKRPKEWKLKSKCPCYIK